MRPVGLGATVSGVISTGESEIDGDETDGAEIDGDRDKDSDGDGDGDRLVEGEPAEGLTGDEDSVDGEGDGDGDGDGDSEGEPEGEDEGEGEVVLGLALGLVLGLVLPLVLGLGEGVGVGGGLGGVVGRSPCPESPRGRAIHPWSRWSYNTKMFTIVTEGATTTTFPDRYPAHESPVARGVPD